MRQAKPDMTLLWVCVSLLLGYGVFVIGLMSAAH
jgi:hypothetical protein